MTTTALVVPDPSAGVVPAGWWQQVAEPVIAAVRSWQELNELEAQILAMAAFIEAKGGDRLEFEKALRIVEKRRGELLGPEPRKRGPSTGDEFRPQAAEIQDVKLPPEKTARTYRALARHWPLIYPLLLAESDPKKVTQIALLQWIARRRSTQRIETITARQVEARFTKLYSAVVIDPPWPMEKIERAVRPHQAKFDYPTMSEEQLAALKPLPLRAASHVWVWTTQRFLPMAFRLLDAWDLAYVCTFVWHKPGGFQPVGLPQYNCEFALYARRGAPKFTSTKNLKVCFTAPRGKHSEKPEIFYDMVRRVTVGRRLDMYNRRAIPGFDGWGNEAAC